MSQAMSFEVPTSRPRRLPRNLLIQTSVIRALSRLIFGLTGWWKTGFYWIAIEAKVPIVCAFIDYANKTGGFTGDVIQPSGDIDADFARFERIYSVITPKFPSKMSPIRPMTGSALPAN